MSSSTVDKLNSIPVAAGGKQGVKVKINAESTWNRGPMLRTQLLPTIRGLSFWLRSPTDVGCCTLDVVYSFPPQIRHTSARSERHYADIKYGQLSGQNGVADALQVITGGKSIWSLQPEKGTWYNFILETGSPGGLWVSTGSDALEKVYDGSLNGNGGTGADWHIGALRLPLDGTTQQINKTDFYYS